MRADTGPNTEQTPQHHKAPEEEEERCEELVREEEEQEEEEEARTRVKMQRETARQVMP